MALQKEEITSCNIEHSRRGGELDPAPFTISESALNVSDASRDAEYMSSPPLWILRRSSSENLLKYDIYLELRDDVQVDRAPNAVAALFRIFMELSLDYYIKKKGIVLNEKGKVSIKQKIKAVSDYMEEEGVIDAIDLKNIRRVASEKNSYLGVEVFHEYMHSLETKPEPLDLKTKWDNLEGFFETLWSDVS